MRVGLGVAAVALLALAYGAAVASAFANPYQYDITGDPEEAYTLRNVKVMRFNASRRTTAGGPAGKGGLPQMKCVGGTSDCPLGLLLSWAECKNVGFDGVDVRWECDSDIDARQSEIRDVLVHCDDDSEGAVIPGSCYMRYILDELVDEEVMDLLEVKYLEFYEDGVVIGRRTRPKPMMLVDEGGVPEWFIPELLPEHIGCASPGALPDGAVLWRCAAEMSLHVALDDPIVMCEEVRHEDPSLDKPSLVLKDSCRIEYNIIKVSETEKAILVDAQSHLEFDSTNFFVTAYNQVPRSSVNCTGSLCPEKMKVVCDADRPVIKGPISRTDALKVWKKPEWECTTDAELPAGMSIVNVSIACEGSDGLMDVFVDNSTCIVYFNIGPKVEKAPEPEPEEPKIKPTVELWLQGGRLTFGWRVYFIAITINYAIWFFACMWVMICPASSKGKPRKKEE